MINNNELICPNCGGDLKYYDKVRRILRTKKRETKRVQIRRLRCSVCGSVHRELPNYILPYKQYETEVIIGVIEGLISPDTIGYEDYPCEATMNKWKKQNSLKSFLQSTNSNLE